MRTPMKTPTRRTGVVLVMSFTITMLACDRSVISPDDGVARSSPVLALGNDYSGWSAPQNIESVPGTSDVFNTAFTDGCPFISPDGKSFYMASNRGGSQGLDIWVSNWSEEAGGWGAPQNVGSPVNSIADDFCPTMSRDGKLLYFVSRRPGGCGGSDVYVARLKADKGFEGLEHLPCDDTVPYDAVNSPADEFSPFPQLDPGVGPVLYFSSFRAGGFAVEPIGGAPDSDLYWSGSHGGVFGKVELIPAVNSAADDGQPNVSSAGRELYFYSTRLGGVGSADLYVSTRTLGVGTWSTPSNLTILNSTAAETRPSLSWDGLSLYFGSTRAGGNGMTDIYFAARQRLVPGEH